MINDIWGLKQDPQIAAVIAAHGHVACCLMHNRKQADYVNFAADWYRDLEESVRPGKGSGNRAGSDHSWIPGSGLCPKHNEQESGGQSGICQETASAGISASSGNLPEVCHRSDVGGACERAGDGDGGDDGVCRAVRLRFCPRARRQGKLCRRSGWRRQSCGRSDK